MSKLPKYLLRIQFFLSIFLPTFQVYLGSVGSAVVNLAIMTFGIAVTFFYREKLFFCYRDNFSFLIVSFLLLIYLLYIPFSMFNGLVFNSISFTFRDAYDLHRPLLYYFSFVSVFLLVNRRQSNEEIENMLLLIFLIIALMGMAQFFKIGRPIFELYTKEHNLLTGRSSAPFINPYDFGFFISFFTAYFTIKFLKDTKIYILHVFLCILLIAMTQSRSILIGIAFILVIIMPFAFFSLEWRRMLQLKMSKKLLLLFSLIMTFIVSVFLLFEFISEHIPYVVNGLTRTFSGEKIHSLSVREEQFNTAIDYAQSSVFVVLFGNGPAKSVLEFVESIYTYFFFRYGIVGFLLFFMSIFTIGLLASYNKLKIHKQECLYLAIFIWLFIIPVVSFTNNFTEQVRLSYFYYFILAIVISEHKTSFPN